MNPAMTFRLALCSAIAASLAPTVAWAQAPGTDGVQGKDTVRFDIPSQPMATALQAFAEQAGMQLLYCSDAISGLTAPALSGEFDRRMALGQLLAGTNLEVVYSSPLIATIRVRAAVPTTGQKAGAIEGVAPSVGPTDREEPPPVGKDNPVAMESIVVTGSRIRGGTSPSAVITIGAETIREEGFTDLGEVARSIPQNFRGGQNPGTSAGAAAGAGGLNNQNVTGGGFRYTGCDGKAAPVNTQGARDAAICPIETDPVRDPGGPLVQSVRRRWRPGNCVSGDSAACDRAVGNDGD